MNGWALIVFLPLAVFIFGGAAAIWRCLRHGEPVVDLRLLGERSFALSCLYSFVLGMGLYASVYLLPLYLGIVREHSPLEIGEIMIVCGAAQLIVAPIAASCGAALRSAPGRGHRLCTVRGRPAVQRLCNLRDGFLGPVLAAGAARRRHDALPAAHHDHRARVCIPATSWPMPARCST